MPNKLPIALFLFTDKNCSRLPELPDEAGNLKNIFEHHQDSFKYEVAFNFSKAAFTQTFVANGKDAAIFHLAGHGVAEGFVTDGDAQNQSILDANILTVFLQNSAQLQIIFINACQSFDTINAINTLNIPLRIGTKHDISDADAMAASFVFYNALLKGHTFEAAFDALNKHYFLLNRNDTNTYEAIWQSETAKNLVLNLKNNQKDNDGFAHALNASPFLQTQTIIGRDEDIKKIHDLLFTQKQLLLMNAMGGIGKTTTALYYAKTYRTHYTHIIWVNGENSLADSLLNDKSLLTNLNLTETVSNLLKNNQRDDAFETIKASIFALHTPILWLIDNANKAACDACRLLQGLHTDHHFLFTSREIHKSIATYNLGYLEKADALKLFYEWAKRIKSNADNDALISNLLEKAHRHTLTIVILAKTFQNKTGESLADFCHEYTQALLNLDEDTEIDLDNHTSGSLGYNILLRVFNTADIRKNTNALHLLTQLSVMPSQDLDFTILKELLITDDFTLANLRNSTNTLLQTGWLEQPNPESPVYFCHSLIQEVIRVTEQVDFEKVEDLLNTLQTILYNNNNNEWWKNAVYLPYAIAFTDNIKQENAAIAGLYNSIGYTIDEQGDYDTALDFYKKALDIREKVLGTEHPSTATSYNNAAGIYKSKGDYDTTLGYYKKALAIRKKVLGIEHPDTAQSYNNIAMLYKVKGDYDTALDFYKKAVAIYEKVLGTEHADTATSYNNIGLLYKSKGDYDTALNCYEKSLNIKVKVLGTEHPSTAMSYNNIGALYQEKGDYDTALDYHKKALDIWEKVLGTEHPNTATSYNNAADIYEIKGDYDTALNYYKKALDIREKVLGTEHPSTATSYNNIGFLYHNKGDYDTALNYCKKALEIFEKVLGTEHPDTATFYNNIAFLYENKGDYDTALNFYKKAVIMLKKTLTLQHPNTKTVFDNYMYALNKAAEKLPNDIIAAHKAFIQAEFSEYL